MGFFLQIHRSITDPSFYAEIQSLRANRAIAYCVKLIVLTVLVLATTMTIRVLNRDEGLPKLLPALFPNMQITATGMIPNAPTPYVVNPVHCAEAVTLFTNTPEALIEIPDSAVVVDSRTSSEIGNTSRVLLRLAADMIMVTFSPEFSFRIPYSVIVNKDEVLNFTTEGVAEYLKHRHVSLFINFCVQHLLSFTLNIMLSIFFLSFAAFIFKSRQLRSYKMILKMSLFAVTPIAIETILVAIAGVQFTWVWQIGIFISVFVLYRGILYVAMTKKENPPREI